MCPDGISDAEWQALQFAPYQSVSACAKAFLFRLRLHQGISLSTALGSLLSPPRSRVAVRTCAQSLPSMFRLRIAVLPAPPVLEPTRAIVLCFNHALAMNLGRFLHSGPPLRYLDIQDDLLEGPGVERLRDKGKMEALARGIGEGHLQGSEDSVDLREIRLKGHYRLDGTHLSPAVVELVAGAVGEA